MFASGVENAVSSWAESEAGVPCYRSVGKRSILEDSSTEMLACRTLSLKFRALGSPSTNWNKRVNPEW